jgi:nitroimidazol reductase NimA-like FMN-containing flavoprotein (pyridoxamine 5'-phosphate oxidase superfamily)
MTLPTDLPADLIEHSATPIPEEARALLRATGWGVLAVRDAQTRRPYAVPVAYAFDGEAIFVATRPGRKLCALDEDPGACLTIVRVDRFDAWRSVIVTGTAQWVTGAARAHAVRAFLAQRRPGGRTFTLRDAARMLDARIFRIVVEELTVRSQGPLSLEEPDAPLAAGQRLHRDGRLPTTSSSPIR